MKKSLFRILLVAMMALTCSFAVACGDLENEEGASCDPDEEAAEGFECLCEDDEDGEVNLDTCTLEAEDDTDDNNTVSDSSAVTLEGSGNFDPATLTITDGTEVTWTNNYGQQIALVSDDISDMDVLINDKATGTYTFNTIGEFTIMDRINDPVNTMTIKVVDE